MGRGRRLPPGELQNLIFAKALAGRNTNVIMPREYLYWRASTNVLAVLMGVIAALLTLPLGYLYFHLGFQGDLGEVLVGLWFAQIALVFIVGVLGIAVQFVRFIVRLIFGRLP